jgi:PAS domain S-box-containing protein
MSEPETDGYLESALARAQHAEATDGSRVEPRSAITYAEDFESGRTFAVGPQVEAILGYTPEEWMGEANLCNDCVHPDDRDRVVAACDLANRTGEPYRVEYRMVARDGSIVWICDEAVLVRGSNGQPLCWQGVMRDITAQKQTA